MNIIFVAVSLWNGLLFNVEVSGFKTPELCQMYAANVVSSMEVIGHEIVEADCITKEDV